MARAVKVALARAGHCAKMPPQEPAVAKPVSDSGTSLRIGKYVVERTLGRGAMGIVYEARRASDGLRVALKTMLPDQIGDTVDHAVERFAHEVIAMVSLQHPGIVKVFDWDRIETPQQSDLLFFAMELLDGETLEQSVKRGPFAPGEVAAIGAAIADALHYAHGQGVVHRDIKPANVFLTRDRRLVITDFGVCKLTNLRPVTTMGSFIGTAPFLAPEVVLDQEADGRSDVFSLGALCYNLLTRGFLRPVTSIGELLYAITTGKEAGRMRQLAGFDPRLIEALAVAVEKEPELRFQSALDFGDALRPLAAPLPEPGPGRAIATLPAGLAVEQEAAGFRIASAARAVQVADSLPSPRIERASRAFSASATRPATPGAMTESQRRQLSESQRRRLDDPRRALTDSQAAALFESQAQAPAPQRLLDTKAGRWRREQVPDAVGSRAGAVLYTSPEQIEVIGQGGGIQSAAFAYFGLNPAQVALIDRSRDRLAPDQMLNAVGGTTESVAPPLSASMQRALRVDGLERPHRVIKLAPRHYAIGGGATAAAMAAIAGLLALRSVEIPIETDPPGATVVVDKKVVGRTPLRLPVRRYQRLQAVISVDGHEPVSREVAPGLLGEPKPLKIQLPLLVASLDVATRPSGAVVTVDGAAICRTPCQISSLAPRVKHSVVASRDGCLPLTWAVDLEPGAAAKRQGDLRPYSLEALALLQILTDVAPIRLDGEDVTEAVALGETLLLPGEHWLQVGSGDRARTVVVALDPGQSTRADLRAPAPPGDTQQRKPGPTPALGASLIPAVDDAAGRGIGALISGNLAAAEAQFKLALAHDGSSLRAQRGLLFTAVARKNLKRAQELARSYVDHAHARDAEIVRMLIEAAANAESCLAKDGG
ncbi:MAG: serine/threonine protein kinase [Deltaproteobacteria bacterium]|nr:serine/threonine protein kinase [Deltaproteobacteria bacterium]